MSLLPYVLIAAVLVQQFNHCEGRVTWNQRSAREDSWGSHEKGRAARASLSTRLDRTFDGTTYFWPHITKNYLSSSGWQNQNQYHVTMNARVGNLLNNQLLVGSVNPRSNIATVSLTLHDTNNNIIQSHVGQPLQFQSNPQDMGHLIQPRSPNVPYSYAKFLITPVDRSNFDPTKIFFHFSLSTSDSNQPTTTASTTSTSPQSTTTTTIEVTTSIATTTTAASTASTSPQTTASTTGMVTTTGTASTSPQSTTGTTGTVTATSMASTTTSSPQSTTGTTNMASTTSTSGAPSSTSTSAQTSSSTSTTTTHALGSSSVFG